MTLSTELAAAKLFSEHAPEMLHPTLGKNAREEKKEIKFAYPEFVPGKRVTISARDKATWDYIRAGYSYFESQKELVGNVMRLLLGDAQYGESEEGLIFVERRIFPKEGYNVDPATEDALYPVKH